MDRNLIRKILNNDFPDVDIEKLQFNEDGLYNIIAIDANNRRIYRFPRKEEYKKILKKEIQFLDYISNHITMHLPKYDLVKNDYVASELIDGINLSLKYLNFEDDESIEKVAKDIGLFLSELHSIGISDNIDTSFNRSVERWDAVISRYREIIYPLCTSYTRDWIETIIEPFESGKLSLDFEPKIIHGDLAPYHIKIDQNTKRVNGIIDFGSAGIGDPAMDITPILATCGESFVKRISYYYPYINEFINRARFYAYTAEIEWLLASVNTDDKYWLTLHLSMAKDIGFVNSDF